MSSLNIKKIERFLFDNKFIIQAFFITQGKCRYIKIFSIVTADSLLLYISPDYNFILEGESADNIFEITPIEFNTGDDIINKYMEYPSIKDMAKKYESVNGIDKSIKGVDMEVAMENNYNKKIFLNKLSKENEILVKDCFRQIRRMALCFQDLSYKMCIFDEEYCCILDSGDEISSYYVKGHRTEDQKLFFIVVSLELFYEKRSDVSSDVSIIKSNIYSILDKNQESNLKILENLTKKLEDVPNTIKKIEDKKREYMECIKKYKMLLEAIDEFEKEATEKESHSPTNEISYVHHKASMKEKLQSASQTRQKILKNLTKITMACDNLYLKTDKNEFDSSIMMDGVLQCMKELGGI